MTVLEAQLSLVTPTSPSPSVLFFSKIFHAKKNENCEECVIFRVEQHTHCTHRAQSTEQHRQQHTVEQQHTTADREQHREQHREQREQHSEQRAAHLRNKKGANISPPQQSYLSEFMYREKKKKEKSILVFN